MSSARYPQGAINVRRGKSGGWKRSECLRIESVVEMLINWHISQKGDVRVEEENEQ